MVQYPQAECSTTPSDRTPIKNILQRFACAADKVVWVALVVGLLSSITFRGLNETIIIPSLREIQTELWPIAEDSAVLTNLQKDYATLSQDEVAERLSELHNPDLKRRFLEVSSHDALEAAQHAYSAGLAAHPRFKVMNVTNIAYKPIIAAFILCGFFWLNRRLTLPGPQPSRLRTVGLTLTLGVASYIGMGAGLMGAGFCALKVGWSSPLLPFIGAVPWSFAGACIGSLPGLIERQRRKALYGAMGGAVGGALPYIVAFMFQISLCVSLAFFYICWAIAIIICGRNAPPTKVTQTFPHRSWTWLFACVFALLLTYAFLPVPYVPIYCQIHKPYFSGYNPHFSSYAPKRLTPELRKDMEAMLTKHHEWNKLTDTTLWIPLRLFLDKGQLWKYARLAKDKNTQPPSSQTFPRGSLILPLDDVSAAPTE